MTIFYLDPVNGNDANAGTSFATRWQTITNGATAARIAPGDTIRIIKSPDPVNTGLTSTWTNANVNVTISSSVTANIALCNSAWTGVTNVTSTAGTVRNEGTNSAQVSVLAAFTTGKAAYFTTGALDLSAYQQVSFWLAQTAGTVAVSGDYSICLCSDTIGAVPVVTIPIPAMVAVNTSLRPITYDFGSALPSDINSIALYVNVDRGAATFCIDSVLACLAATNPACITLNHMIGLNDGSSWAPIRSISGTVITLGTDTGQGLNISPIKVGYCGRGVVSEPLYSMLPLERHTTEASSTGSTLGGVTDSGTAGSPITFSGGWDTTDMSTQTGYTWISGKCSYGCGMRFSGCSYINIDHLSFTKFQSGIFITNSSYINYVGEGMVGCTSGFEFVQGFVQSYWDIRADHSCYNGCVAGTPGGGVVTTTGACHLTNSKIQITNVSCNAGVGSNFGFLNNSRIQIDYIRGNNASGFALNGAARSLLLVDTIVDTTVFSGYNYNPCTLLGCYETTFTVNSIDGSLRAQPLILMTGGNSRVIAGTLKAQSGNYIIQFSTFDKIDIQVSNVISGNGPKLGTVNQSANSIGGVASYSGPTLTPTVTTGRLCVYNIGGDEKAHRIIDIYGDVYSGVDQLHTSGTDAISWKLAPNSLTNSEYRLTMPIANVYVVKNQPVTVSAYFYRESATNNGGLLIKGYQLNGVNETFVPTSDLLSWQQVSTTFTPTETGVIEICAASYGANYLWVDDFSVSQ